MATAAPDVAAAEGEANGGEICDGLGSGPLSGPRKRKAGTYVFQKEYDKSKSNILKSVEYLVDNYEGNEILPKNKAKEILKNESNNKETMFNLYLFLTDPNKQKLFDEANELGKQDPQTEQNNPLGMK